MRGDFHLARLVIPWWHLSDKCCLLYPCPKQYREKNLLIQACACKCFRGEGKKKTSPVGFLAQYSKYKLSTLTTAIKLLSGSKMRSRAVVFWSGLFFLMTQSITKTGAWLTATAVLLIADVPWLFKRRTQRSLVVAYSHVSLTITIGFAAAS